MSTVQTQGKAPQKRILVIEDDPDISFIMKRRLSSIRPDDKILIAKSIFAGVTMFQEKAVDFIFLDLNLPDSFGISSVRDIRKYNKNVPIIVTTGLANELTIEEALKHGAQELVLKSQITKEYLEEALNKYLVDAAQPAPTTLAAASGGQES